MWILNVCTDNRKRKGAKITSNQAEMRSEPFINQSAR